MKPAKCVLGIAVVLGLVFAVAFAYGLIKQAGEAEATLHAQITVLYVIADYIDLHGEWPKSWDALLEFTPAEPIPSMYEWPRHAGEIQRRVRVDFDCSLEGPGGLEAIHPIGPHYRLNEHCIGYLEQSIRSARLKRRD